MGTQKLRQRRLRGKYTPPKLATWLVLGGLLFIFIFFRLTHFCPQIFLKFHFAPVFFPTFILAPKIYILTLYFL